MQEDTKKRSYAYEKVVDAIELGITHGHESRSPRHPDATPKERYLGDEQANEAEREKKERQQTVDEKDGHWDAQDEDR